MHSVTRGAYGTRNWTCAQYCAAALALLDSPYSAVTEEQMQAIVGSCVTSSTDVHEQQSVGAPALRALLKAGHFILRPHSDWALDMPHEAYYDASKQVYSTAVVTAPTPTDLYCMSRMRTRFEECLQQSDKSYKIHT
jgi:hypothetical protein